MRLKIVDRPLHVLALVGFATFTATAARAEDFAVLVAGGTPRYEEAARAASTRLGAPVRRVAEDARVAPSDWVAAPPKVIVAVGARAVRLALLVPGAQVVAAMVLQDGMDSANPRVVEVPFIVPLERQLQLLAALAPDAKRVGMIVDPRVSGALVAEAEAAAKATGHKIVVRPVTSPDAALQELEALPGVVDALLLVPDTTVIKRQLLDRAAALGLERRVATLGFSGSLVQVGFLAALAPDPEENGATAALIAKKLGGGAGPESLKADARMTGKVHVHAGTATKLGLSIPPDLEKPPAKIYR